MDCEICSYGFNEKDHIPKNLTCGHTFCQQCMESLFRNGSIRCPKCRVMTNKVEIDSLAVNYPILCMINDQAMASAQSNTTITEVGKLLNTQTEQIFSPHGGRCLNVGATIAYHCAYCKLWLCEECTKIDHNSSSCIVTPQKDTLSQMMQSRISKAANSCRDFKVSKRRIMTYNDQLKYCKAIMETTLDCINTEEKRLEKLTKECTESEDSLQKFMEDQTIHDLSETLSVMQALDVALSDSQKWQEGIRFTHLDKMASNLSKELLLAAVQLHLDSTGTGASREVLALHTVNSTPVCSRLKTESDGSLQMHALEQMNSPSGALSLQLECVKHCIGTPSALTFLDLSWGNNQGRIYIRLMGPSTRAQQFLMMCTGEKGPTLRKTRFHRIWWRGQPGEHVWAGDYDEGDGSGGILPSEISGADEQEESLESCYRPPITAGLVAGSYGRKCNSSIFRIYTRKSKDTTEEAAFGQVESGLDVLNAAIQHNKITDVIISDCGVIIEP